MHHPANGGRCRYWLGAHHRRLCDATHDIRRYLPGQRCPQHTPAALAGRPEAPTFTNHRGRSTMAPRTHSPTLLHNAIAAAERGWRVFPLVPGGKTPAVKAWETRATTDPDRIRRCWSTGPYNIGVACGPSGLVVVDLDTPKPGQHPPEAWRIDGVHDGFDVLAVVCERVGQPLPCHTYTVTTGRGGTHLYFRHPEAGPALRNTAGMLGWLIDTRAHGGYVVGAASIVSGRTYTLTHDTHPAPLAAWLADRLTPAPLPPQEPVTVHLGTGRRGAFLDKAVHASVHAIAAAPDGTLNRTLYGAAVALGQLVAGGALNAEDTEAILLQAAVRAGHPATPAQRTIRSGFRAGTRRPRTLASAA